MVNRMQMLWALILQQASHAAVPQPDSLKDIAGIAKDLSSALQSLATIIALFLGGLWTFRAFVKGRGNYPRAKIEHLISHRRLPNQTWLLIVDVFVENIGSVAIPLLATDTWVQRILPLPDAVQSRIDADHDPFDSGQDEGAWELLGPIHERRFPKHDYIVDCGERDQFRHNFHLPESTQTIQVYTYLKPTKGGLGWKLKTTYEINVHAEPAHLAEKSGSEEYQRMNHVYNNSSPQMFPGDPKQPPDPPPPPEPSR
jgi:hypothetical protein